MQRLAVINCLAVALGACAQTQGAPLPEPSAPAAQRSALDIDQFIATVDVDADGVMSHEEWFGVGLPRSAFDMLDKDRDEAVASAEMHAEAPPPGIDLNGDGVLTLAEFLEFDRRMSASAPGR